MKPNSSTAQIVTKPKVVIVINRRGGGTKTTLSCALIDAFLEGKIEVALVEAEQDERITPLYKDRIDCAYLPFNAETDRQLRADAKILARFWDKGASFIGDSVEAGKSVVMDTGSNSDIRFAEWLKGGGKDELNDLDAEIHLVVPLSTDGDTIKGAMASLKLVLPHLPNAKVTLALSAPVERLMVPNDNPGLGELLRSYSKHASRAVRFPIGTSSLMSMKEVQTRRHKDVSRMTKVEFIQALGLENTRENRLEVGREIEEFRVWWQDEVAAAGVIIGTVEGEKNGFALLPKKKQEPKDAAA
ncbi:hypothetical protein [Sabulicella rubraurantiaca]|uniref:hypothetical protein n=1 Tax=Sabulicella rubraurantiaca TaxID=2811429 RepID=UPI001A96D45A|nr:hypothetical protein [Sabulicella rubraurantiaca]